MSWESFIEKNVREALVKQGYTPAIAQGGQTKLSSCTGAYLGRAGRGPFMTMFIGTRNGGPRIMVCRPAVLSHRQLRRANGGNQI